MLADADGRRRWARNGQRRVHAHFLAFAQIGAWLTLLDRALDAAAPPTAG
jgi:hypothetical protein